MKIITFAVPCYNSAEYMCHCIDTLLTGGSDIEIILVNDGSNDATAEIADRYAQRFPTVVRTIHQPNGGHGEGVNQGLRHASGLYYKVVDSDDWLDEQALQTVLYKLRELANEGKPVDMLVTNYVYEHVEDNTSNTVRYSNVFPQDRCFGWEDVGRFMPGQSLLMHSVIYRTQVLRDCGIELPKHTFYVDNIFVFQPLPYVKTMYYINVDLYRYFIGRNDQSVNEQVMVKRIDQQLRVTRIMMKLYDLPELKNSNCKLGNYMINYFSTMMTISSILLLVDGSREALAKRTKLWQELYAHDSRLYHKVRYRSLATLTVLPGRVGRSLSVSIYRLARRLVKFS